MNSSFSEQPSRTPQRWSRSPKHLLRMAAIEDICRGLVPGTFLEAGAGNGDLTRRFAERGFRGTAYDLGEDARAHLRETLGETGVAVVETLDAAPVGVDYLFAFEVLEHVPNDLDVLSEWARHLRFGGRVVLSVPAHQRKFSSIDRRVGHVRRYEADQLRTLLTQAGFDGVDIINYAFPLGNLTRRAQQAGMSIARLLGRRDRFEEDEDAVARSIRSGVETSPSLNAVSHLVNARTLWLAVALQRRFYRRDWGDGYVASGVRTRAAATD